MKYPLLLVFFCFLSQVYAAQVDTIAVFSKKMNKDVKVVAISPEKGKASSTLYLLHGHSGNYSNWVTSAPQIKELVDRFGYLVVCPDGGFDSWYWDTEDANYQYESFITKELLPFIEKRFQVGSTRANRAITGLSMGGHGALYLAFKHQDLFAFAGSTAGGVDIRPFPDNWGMKKRLGAYSENPQKWNEHTVMELTHLVQPGALQLFIDCGTGDFFYEVNNKLHEKLTYLNIPHHYLTMPGRHDWNYWSRSIAYQMEFFNQCFQSKFSTK
ncbi:alpha/beta hydrolase [Sphingobacterium sp. LRF_L2]|uniref:alpha/beta hydrolase n=1 Tax=Sphingobacterium sp. LRF_L2 TaxID=3369421 RepID=UPI003F5E190E